MFPLLYIYSFFIPISGLLLSGSILWAHKSEITVIFISFILCACLGSFQRTKDRDPWVFFETGSTKRYQSAAGGITPAIHRGQTDVNTRHRRRRRRRGLGGWVWLGVEGVRLLLAPLCISAWIYRIVHQHRHPDTLSTSHPTLLYNARADLDWMRETSSLIEIHFFNSPLYTFLLNRENNHDLRSLKANIRMYGRYRCGYWIYLLEKKKEEISAPHLFTGIFIHHM